MLIQGKENVYLPSAGIWEIFQVMTELDLCSFKYKIQVDMNKFYKSKTLNSGCGNII